MSDVLAFFQSLVADPQFKILVSAIVVNAVLAVTLAIVGNQFSWTKLPDFGQKQALPFAAVWLVLKIFDQYSGLSVAIPGVGTAGILSSAFFASALASLAAKIVQNLQAVLPKT